MLTGQRARQVVLSALTTTSSTLGAWQTRVETLRHLLYRKDEPLSSITGYFEHHSKTDWSPVRRFTARCVAQDLRSRLAICLFTNVPFADATPLTLCSFGSVDPIIVLGEADADCEDEANDNDLFFESSEAFELDDCYLASSSESRSLSVSSPTLSTAPFEQSPGSDLMSRRLRRRQSPTFGSLYDDSADEQEDEDDEEEPTMAPTSFFVPINDGHGLDHVFVGQDTSSTQSLEENSDDSSRNSSSTTDLFAGSPDTGLSSPSPKFSKAGYAEMNKLLEDNMQLEEENFLINVQMGKLERKNADLNVAVGQQNHLIKYQMDNNKAQEQEIEALKSNLAQQSSDASRAIAYLKDLVHTEEKRDVREQEVAKAEQARNGQVNELLEENVRLEAENSILNVQMDKLAGMNGDLNVALKEQIYLNNHHIQTSHALEQEKDALKTKLAQWHSGVSREIDRLEGVVSDLESANDGLEARIETLTDEVTDRDIQIGNYSKVFEQYKTERKATSEETTELRQVIEAYPDHSRVLLQALTKRDERIARLKQLVKNDRICDIALERAYAKFAAKYNNVVGLANVRLEVGVLLSQRLAEAEAYLLQEGHASPVSDREGVWEDAYHAFRVNENGLWDTNDDGDDLMITPELEIAENPDGWLPGLLKKIWLEEEEVEEGGDEAGSPARRITWVGDDEDRIIEAEDGNNEDGHETQHCDNVDEVDAFLNSISVENEDPHKETIDAQDFLYTDRLRNATSEDANAESSPNQLIHNEPTPVINEEPNSIINTPQIDQNEAPLTMASTDSTIPPCLDSTNNIVNDGEQGESDPPTKASKPFNNPAPTAAPVPPPFPFTFRPVTTTQKPSLRPKLPPRTGSSATHKRNMQRKQAKARRRALSETGKSQHI